MVAGKLTDTLSGKTLLVDDIETAFIAHARRVAEQVTCFLVVSPHVPPDYRARLDVIGLPMVEGEIPEGPGVFIVAGKAEDWPKIKPEVAAEYEAARAAGAL